MHWQLGDNNQHLRSKCGRFYLPKFNGIDGPVYRLVDGDKGICTEFGEGAKERCMRQAEEIIESERVKEPCGPARHLDRG